MKDEVIKSDEGLIDQQMKEVYETIREYVIDAQRKVYSAVNTAMVETYWNIGKKIYEVTGETARAEYGKRLLENLSTKLMKEFGKGFEISNLRRMRRLYCQFPIGAVKK